MAQCEKLKDLPRHGIEQCPRLAQFEFDYAPKGTAYPQRERAYYCHFHIYEAYISASTTSNIRIIE